MGALAYLAPELGGLTSTFVYREIAMLRQRGFEVVTFSTLRPREQVFSQEAAAIIQETDYLYDLPKPSVLAAAARALLRRPIRSARALALLLRDMLAAEVPGLPDRVKLAWHFAVGCALARRLERKQARHIHAHFAHVPASVAMYAALTAGRSFSFTAHANDLFERPTALREKVNRAAFVACISEYNRQFLLARGCPPEKLRVVHCGIDVDAYAFQPPPRPQGALRLLSVGRFVEKKGFAVLVDAVRLLRERGHAVQCRIAGDGPLFAGIQAQIQAAGLESSVILLGARPQEEVRQLFSETDVFVLSCVASSTGDMDGIPVALMESMALGVPVVSTRLSGIPELIESGGNGLLAEPNDAAGLAEALQRLIEDPDLARTLAEQARRTIERDFNIARSAAQLANEFTVCLGDEAVR